MEYQELIIVPQNNNTDGLQIWLEPGTSSIGN